MSLITPDFGLLVWMTLIFGIVFFILARFGFPVITEMVDKRAKHIEQSLQDAAKAKQELDGLTATCQKMLDDTRMQQEQMLEQARRSSAQMVEDAKEEARKQAAHIVAVAREQIEVEKREAINDVRNVVVDLAVAVSGKIIGKELQQDDARMQYIDKVLEDAQQAMNNKE